MATNRGLGLLNKFAREGRTIFMSADVRAMLGLSPQATSNLLKRLAHDGLVDKVAGGRYAIRTLGSLGTAAVWDDLGTAVAALLAPHSHRISFLTALDHHGLLVRPVRAVLVASSFRPREKFLSGRPLRVVYETDATIRAGTLPLGPSCIATVERALLDTASRPQLSGGVSRLTEAMCTVQTTSELRQLALQIGSEAGYRRIGSIASTLKLAMSQNLEPPPWRTMIELDRRARGEGGWVDTTWGVAWPYRASVLESVVAS